MNFEHPLLILLHLGCFAFAMSLALCGFMISAGLLDVPVSRSSHKTAVPTGAGVGIVGGLGIGLLAVDLFYPQFNQGVVMGQVAVVALGVALLGLFDDVYEMRSKIKFVFLIILACACVYVIGPPQALPIAGMDISLPVWMGFGGAVLWIFVVMNAVNFMDGVNGMMGSVMCVAFAGLAVVSIGVGAASPAVLSTLMAISLLGFLPYNARQKALIFSGDVGALFCGFMFAACSLLLAAHTTRLGLLYVGPLLILPFLVDVFLTLLVRVKNKENLMLPHRTHMYQRLLGRGQGHISVTSLYVIASAFMGLITLAGVQFGLIRSLFFLVVWVSALSMVYVVMYRKLVSEPSAPDPQHKPPNP